jgi:hypothetical protein
MLFVTTPKTAFHSEAVPVSGSVVVKVAGSRPDEVNFFLIYLILPAALDPWVYSASNRDEYRKQKNNVSAE